MTRLTGSRIANILVIIAVACIPLLYAGLLTSTYTNPTNRIDHMHAAVVNLDKPVTVTLISDEEELSIIDS